MGTYNKSLLLVFIIGVTLRVSIPAVALYLTPDDRSIFHNKDDTMSYVVPARGVVSEQIFGSKGVPETSRTPGYILLLIPGILLGHLELVTVLLQVLLSSLTIALVFGITKTVFEDNAVALTAGLLYALEPLSLIQASILQTETFFTFSLCLFMFYILRYLKDQRIKPLLIAALAASLCAFIRPSAYYMPLTVTLFLVSRAMTKLRPFFRPLFHAIIFLTVAMSPLMVWQLRNQLETGSFVYTTISGNALYFDVASNILAEKLGKSRIDQRYEMGYFDYKAPYSPDNVYFSRHPEQIGWTEVQMNNYQTKAGLKMIMDNPGIYMKNVFIRVAWIMFGPGLSDWFYVFDVNVQNMREVLENRRDPLRMIRGPWLGLIATATLAGLLIFYWCSAIFGLYHARSELIDQKLFLMMILCYYIGITALAGMGYSRYRHPVMPVLCVFGGNGLVAMTRYFKSSPIFQRLRFREITRSS